MSSKKEKLMYEVIGLMKGLTDEQLAEAIKRIKKGVYESRANNQGFRS